MADKARSVILSKRDRKQEALSTHYWESYGYILEALSHIEQTIREEEGKQELDPDSELLWRSLHQNTNLPPELIAAAQHTIVQINEAKDRLVRVIEAGQKALIEHAEQGLIDWTMPFDYEFFLLLDPGKPGLSTEPAQTVKNRTYILTALPLFPG